jgi:hypothetical protein
MRVNAIGIKTRDMGKNSQYGRKGKKLKRGKGVRNLGFKGGWKKGRKYFARMNRNTIFVALKA